uniref:MetQ/NlpA family ABC transporter substrate-binding protein n=1 Tax=Atopococcus tabaci TaxID=269774 RepID=UPI0024098FC0
MKSLKKLVLTLGLTASVSLLAACGASAESDTVKIGVVGEDTDVWDFVIEKVEKEEGIDVELVKFTDYAQPNKALADGEIDLNSFQHKLF